MNNKMKRAYVLFGRLLLVVCMAVCFAEAAFAGSENETFKSVNHKGYNTLAPENTLPAFELSAEKGYQYVETDISFTKDGVPVLLHNPNINNMARNPDGSELAGENLEIDQITYEEALRYDFTKGMAEYKGTKIARLDDFLDLCQEKSLHPYLELKNNGDYTKDQIRELVKLVRSKGMEGKISWISFEADYLKCVREEDSKARLGFLSVVSDEEGMKEAVEAAKDLRTGENEVFLDLANKTPYVTYDYSLCEKEGLPVEIWVSDELNEFMGITERDVLETLDPYVTGATVDKYIYARPELELSPDVFACNGEVRKPEVTVSLDGEKLREEDYELTWPEGCRDEGTYQVTARLKKGILAGADTAEFIIRKDDDVLSDSTESYSEEAPVPSTEADPVSSANADSVPSAEDNLKALHQYNHSYAEKIKAVAEGYPEDSEVRAIYEQYVQYFTEPVPGRPTEEESRLYSEAKLSDISDQLKQAAVDYYKECVRSEPQITSDLYDIAEEVGTEMFGIQNRIKSAGENKEGVCRIADKISQYMSEAELTGNPVSYEEAVRQVKDIIRYTQTGTPETLTQNYLRTKELLEEKGYELVRVRNSWETFTKKAPYRGVNTVYVSPDGIPFELQFHTAESLMTKEAEHPLYEICRDPDTSEAEREALSEERYRMYAGMTQPDRIEEIG